MTTFSKKLFLISTMLLLSGNVLGERRESRQHRRAAVSDRETAVPTEPDIFGVGKGMKSLNSLKSLGKGLKSEKILKSEKSKGKGKGEKIEKSDKKSEKIDKSGKSKSEKKSKHEKSGKHGINFPSTPSPTSADSISSKSSAFAITYSPTMEIPTSNDLRELAMMTEKYLEDFMMSFFDKTALTDLDNFLTIMVRDVFVAGEPVLAEFQSNGLFNPDSIFVPVAQELDNLIQDAIAKDEYLEMLKDLPRSNPFRGTKTITLTAADTSTAEGDGASSTSSGNSESSSIVRAGVAAAAAGVVVLAVGLALLRRRRPSLDDENDDIQSFSPGKTASEDAAYADDTCAISAEDPSNHFAHWRTAKSYNNGSDGGEFQDEPLDS